MQPVSSAKITLAIRTSSSLWCTASMSSSATSTTSIRAGGPGLSARSRVQAAIWSARCAPSWANGKGGQRIEDTGPLTRKQMETIDEEVTQHAMAFIDKAHRGGTPFFVWYNTTGMHFRTHCAEKHKGKSGGQGDYNDVVVAHNENIGVMLAKLDRYDRHVLDRQRPALQQLAGCRDHPLSQREEHQLGRRLAGADLCALARHNQAGDRLQ